MAAVPEVILFGANHYRQYLPRWGSWWCWDKNPEQQPADFASDEWVWLSLDVAPYHYRQLWRGGMRAGEENWVHLPQKLHPAQKPIDLLTPSWSRLQRPWCLIRSWALGPPCGVYASGAAMHRD